MRALFLVLVLTACNGNGLLRGSGEIAPPPGGHAVYCAQHPDRTECGGTK